MKDGRSQLSIDSSWLVSVDQFREFKMLTFTVLNCHVFMLFRLQIILNEIIMWNGNILFQDFLLMGQKTSNK